MIALDPSFDYALDRATPRVILVARGRLTLAGAITVVNQQATDGAWGYGMLHDVRAVTAPLNTTEMRRLLDYIQATSQRLGRSRGPVAVVTQTPLVFGTTRMFATMADDAGSAVGVFRNAREAKRWLDEWACDDTSRR